MKKANDVITAHIGRLTNNIDLTRDLFLGPWCFLDQENNFPDWEQVHFPKDPFDNAQQLAQASQLTVDYTHFLLAELVDELNTLNNTRHSQAFWQIMLMPWLLTLVQTGYERQQRVTQFIQQHKHKTVKLSLIKDDIDWVFYESVDFVINGIFNPLYNEWVFSRLFEKLSPQHWIIDYTETPANTHTSSFNKNVDTCRDWRSYLSNKLSEVEASGLSLVDRLLIRLTLSLKPSKTNPINIPQSRPTKNNDIQWHIDIKALCLKLLPRIMRSVDKLCDHKIKHNNLSNIVGNKIYWNERYKYQLGLKKQRGQKLYITQHGGYYGCTASYPFPSEVEYVHDGFITWGWDSQPPYPGNFIALPSPMLTKLKRFHDKVKPCKHFLLVGTRANLFSYRLDSMPQALQQLTYRKAKQDFSTALLNEIQAKLHYRPYFNEDGSLSDETDYLAKFPNTPILYGDLNSQLSNFRLIILDHPGTCFNICMASNIPVIAFWDPLIWKMTETAEQDFDTLRKAKIVFDDPSTAAKHLNSVYKNISHWWDNAEVISARKEWCHRYAKTDKNWRRIWLKTIWSI